LDDNIAFLENGSLDIWGEPLRFDEIKRLIGNPEVTLASHVDLGMVELDMNNQMWPTGDPNNKFYKPSSVQANQSLMFRRAVACLVDRDELVSSSQYFGGYAYRMDVPIPPQQSAYFDMVNYTVSGLIYNYNFTRAQQFLDAAGFTMLPSGWRQDPTTPSVAMKPITFVIPQDDLRLVRFGQALTDRLESIRIPVNTIIGPTGMCYEHVATYDYNLYIGKWSFSTVPTQYYDLYSSDNYYGPMVGPSPNYVGFCNNGTLFGTGHADAEGFDYWARKVKYPATENDAMIAARTAGYLFLKFCPVIPLLCEKVVQAYRTGLAGVINSDGYGVDNRATFSIMSNPTNPVINYGIKGDPAHLNLNVITSGISEAESPSFVGPAPKVLNMLYDSLMIANPWTLESECWLAQNYSVGSWDATSKGGDVDSTYVNFTIRPDVYWHRNDTPGRSFDIFDINFTFSFMKAVYDDAVWNQPLRGDHKHEMAMSIVGNLRALDHCTVYSATNTTSIYFLGKSSWALQWAGCIPMVNREIWSLLWNTADPNWSEHVRNYDPTSTDLNANGLPDLSEDGTTRCTFSYGINEEGLKRYYSSVNHYGINEEGIKSMMLSGMFHGAGDVNRDGIINILDLSFMARALGTDSSMPHGTNWAQYNPDCDFDGNEVINLYDLTLATTNYGKTISS
jgi:hypothetical protein